MEASYWLLQPRVEQDMEEFGAKHARQAAQQTQYLCDTLQKGIANVITAQLTLVYEELSALQTRATDLDGLVA